jgi:hypothetical protein
VIGHPHPLARGGSIPPLFFNKRKCVMSKNFNRTYVSKICPELLESEVEIVYEEVLVDSDPTDVYPKQVRDVAERMFPYILTGLPPVNADNILDLCGFDNLKDASDYLERARHSLESISLPDDDVARVVLEVKTNLNYIGQCIQALIERRNKLLGEQ